MKSIYDLQRKKNPGRSCLEMKTQSCCGQRQMAVRDYGRPSQSTSGRAIDYAVRKMEGCAFYILRLPVICTDSCAINYDSP